MKGYDRLEVLVKGRAARATRVKYPETTGTLGGVYGLGDTPIS